MEKIELTLLRARNENNLYTRGVLFDAEEGEHICVTLELPWKKNKRKESRIPAGTYLCVPRWSSKHKEHYILENVKDRSLILIHIGNYVREIEGCILVGLNHADIDKDGIIDVANSKKALENLQRYTGKKSFYLHII